MALFQNGAHSKCNRNKLWENVETTYPRLCHVDEVSIRVPYERSFLSRSDVRPTRDCYYMVFSLCRSPGSDGG